jgi:hypothetical protein
MALDEGDKNTCKEIAREIVKEVILEHVKSCPHGIQLKISKAYIVGMCIGSGLSGGCIGAAIIKVFSSIV